MQVGAYGAESSLPTPPASDLFDGPSAALALALVLVLVLVLAGVLVLVGAVAEAILAGMGVG